MAIHDGHDYIHKYQVEIMLLVGIYCLPSIRTANYIMAISLRRTVMMCCSVRVSSTSRIYIIQTVSWSYGLALNGKKPMQRCWTNVVHLVMHEVLYVGLEQFWRKLHRHILLTGTPGIDNFNLVSWFKIGHRTTKLCNQFYTSPIKGGVV